MKTSNNNISVNAQSYTHPNPTKLIKNGKNKFKTLREKKDRCSKTLRFTKITFTTHARTRFNEFL